MVLEGTQLGRYCQWSSTIACQRACHKLKSVFTHRARNHGICFLFNSFLNILATFSSSQPLPLCRHSFPPWDSLVLFILLRSFNFSSQNKANLVLNPGSIVYSFFVSLSFSSKKIENNILQLIHCWYFSHLKIFTLVISAKSLFFKIL